VIQLKGFQKQYLRGKAHGLKPVVLVGQKGLTDALIDSVNENLNAHELIKVKFNEHKEKAEKAAICEEIGLRTGSALAGMVGHTAILYRPHPDPERRRFRLPTTPADAR
jgi:RNA-binding protein